jgi:hypothetical protein
MDACIKAKSERPCPIAITRAVGMLANVGVRTFTRAGISVPSDDM